MKIPPPPLTYSKDRNLTRRTVKGAAGGMKGVDYEDDGRPAFAETKATVGAGSNAQTPGGKDLQQVIKGQAAGEAAEPEAEHKKIREEDETVLDDEDATTRDKKARENRRGWVPRDRMTVDKDAPKLLRKPKWEYDEDEDAEHETPEPHEDFEFDLDDIAERIVGHDAETHLEDRKRRQPGDPSLTDPADMQRRLGTPIAYAKHTMILAEAFRSAGATRDEAVAYSAALFCAAPDRAFGRVALKELGTATGILDIYPLEVVEHILSKYPAFLPKVGYGTLFANVEADTTLTLEAGVAHRLTYPEGMIIRGFAIVGGGRPGYRFEPATEPDVYLLTIGSGGRFELLISGLLKSGHTIIDRIECEVAGEAAPPCEIESRERNANKLAAWPQPVVLPIDPLELLAEYEPKDDDGMMTSGEIVQRQQLGALRGPKGEPGADDTFDDLPALEEADPTHDDLEVPEGIDELPPIEDVEGPPTDEVQMPDATIEVDRIPPSDTDVAIVPDEPAPMDDDTADVLLAPVSVVDAPTYEGDPMSMAEKTMRRIREEAGGSPQDNALSVADQALLDIAFATMADPAEDDGDDDT